MTDAEDDDSQIFPQRLMQILSDEGNCESIAWLPHGRAFVVKSRTHFESIMPQYFSRKAKYSSFTRKLNRWNFVRVSSGPEAGSYYHEFFLRDKPHLVAQMFCKNARSKLAMTGSVVQGPSKDATVAIAPSRIEPVSPVHHHRMEPNHQQQQQAYNLDIPLALLHLLVKPAPSDPRQQLSAAGAQPQPGILLQQSQYANLLLERQIQILQQEQAEQMLHLLSQDSKPAASKEDQHLRQMQHIMQNNQQRQKKSPTNHRASAA